MQIIKGAKDAHDTFNGLIAEAQYLAQRIEPPTALQDITPYTASYEAWKRGNLAEARRRYEDVDSVNAYQTRCLGSAAAIHRVRIENGGPYERWETEVCYRSHLAQEAESTIGIVAEHTLKKYGVVVPNDVWIFDRKKVLVFEANEGKVVGAKVMSDEAEVAPYLKTYDTVAPLAVPLSKTT